MRGRWNGGYVGPWQTPSAGNARGIFNAAEMQQLSGAGLWPQPANDPYFQYVTALLQGNGGPPTSVSGTNTINFNADASTNNFQLNLNGDVRNDEFHPYQQGFYSNFFDGTGDYLTISDNAAFEMTGDFTIECWFYATSAAANYSTIISKAATGIYSPYTIYLRSSLAVEFWSSTNGSSWNLASGVSFGTVTLGTWNHVAVSRQGANCRLFLNGALVSTISNSTALTDNANAVGIGGRSDGTELFTGYISNVRIVKGQGLYTAAFTPSTTPLTTTSQGATVSNVSLLTCQSNRIIDNGRGATITRNGDVSVQFFQPFGLSAISTSTFTNNQPSPGTNGYYGVYFDGNGDNLAIAANEATRLVTGSFTIECWFYTSNTGTQVLIAQDDGGSGNQSWQLTTSATSQVTFTWFPTSSRGSFQFITGGTYQTNQWNHVAAVYNASNTTLTLYLNGVSVATQSSPTFFNGNNATGIGSWNGNTSSWFTGYISNVRLVKGTAVYTSNFTPSTTPLTAITNTSLLTCQSSSIIDNSGNNLTITANGNAAVTVAQPFTGTVAGSTVVSYGSAYFDGTGDYFTLPTNSNLTLTGDFTIDLWVYPTVASASQTIWSPISPAADRSIQVDGTNTNWVYYDGTANRTIGSFVLNTWTNIVITRSGSTVRGFKDGVQGFSVTDSGTLEFSGQGIGYRTRATAGSNFNGYISNFRLIKGTAIYTANFIPPNMPVTAVSNTQLLSLQYNGGASNSGFEDTGPFDLLVNRAGNVSQGTFTPYGSNWSNYFDGTGDSLSMSSSAIIPNTQSTFTIEGWLYMTANPVAAGGGNVVPAMFGDISGVTNYLSMGPVGSAGTYYLGLYWYDGASKSVRGNTTLALNTWYHLAISISSNTIKLFVNGIEQTLTGTTTLTNRSGNSGSYIVGNYNTNEASITGYVSNLRVVNGTAVYATSFVPSTAPLVAIANTSLLICQSNRFIDNSTNNFTITRNGDTSVQRFSPFRPTVAYNSATYGGSAYFDGTGDYLFNTTQSNAGFNMSSGSWTVEAWVYKTSSAAGTILNLTNNGTTVPGLHFWINSSNQLVQDNGAAATTAAGTVLLNTWAHVAAVCNGTNTQLYINGTPVGSVITQLPNAAQYFFVGAYAPGSTPFPGYISDVRVVKGTAIYTGAFTPPTAPLAPTANTSLLLGMANTGQYDNSMIAYWESANNTQSTRSQYKYGTGSLYFDGTADYLTTRYTQGQWFLSNTFTIEAWVYIIARATSDCPIFSQDVAVTGSFAFQALTILANGTLNFNVRPTTGGGVTSVGGGTVPVGTWTHCAVSVDAGQARVFLNGTQVGSTTAVTMMAATLPQFVGVAGYGNGYNTGVANSNHLNGYIDDLRVTRGIARYTANFTPPGAQFVNT